MKIVDAHTGRHVQLGDVVPSPGREHDWRLLDVYDRFFSAEILIEELRPPRRQLLDVAHGALFSSVVSLPAHRIREQLTGRLDGLS